jgi:CRISPR-associated endonuclease Csy4
MKYFIDITLLPSDDIGHHFLWSKVFQQIHLALVENKNDDGTSSCGITFPEFSEEKQRLGRKLRIFGPEKGDLETLNLPKWLDRLHDYTHITHIRDVPENVEKYVRFTRKQTRSSKERLARRAVKRHDISYEKAMLDRADFQPHLSNTPFIQLKSLGSGNQFRMFVSREVMDDFTQATYSFNAYGLSNGSVLPWF